ncbi:hypothetical protein FGB62_214g011 [Gracilaria domingensis]|nr:hypothetical protein FGB62_214g011 [Gracilaria domingensis]
MAHHVRAHHDASETAGPVRPTASISRALSIQKPQRKRAPKASKVAKKRDALKSTVELNDSVVESYAEPDSTPLLTISADPLKLVDECDSNEAELLSVLPDVLSGDTDVLDDVDEMCSSIPSTFAEDPLEDSADVTLFRVSGSDDATNAKLDVLDRDAFLKAAVEATNLPLNEYALM